MYVPRKRAGEDRGVEGGESVSALCIPCVAGGGGGEKWLCAHFRGDSTTQHDSAQDNIKTSTSLNSRAV